jgi:hypothetical protein
MHPATMYELAKLRIAEDLRQADQERLVRQAGTSRPPTIDAARFRQRVGKLFGGSGWAASRPAGA